MTPRRKIRDLESWEVDLVRPLLARRERARASIAELERLHAATQEEVESIDLALSGFSFAFHGPGADEHTMLDFQTMALFDTRDQTVDSAAEEARRLAAKPLAEAGGALSPPPNDEDPEK